MSDASEMVARSTIDAPAPTGSGAVDEAVAIWRALVALGTRHTVIAPGSRSAPLIYGLADEQVDPHLRAHVRIDERAAAFTALGLSRHHPARPAAVVTTSGTATAHLLAAVMESHHSRIPLLVLTADRPAELRGVGANQTTRQAGLFGDLVRFEADLPAPTAAGATPVELRTAVSTVARAFAAAAGEHPGPVHLNLGFRDPLVPAPTGASEGAGEVAPTEQIVLTRRLADHAPTPQPVPVDARTVVVAGDGAGPGAAEFASRHRLPLLAEPSSGARDSEMLVPGYPALLAEVMSGPAHPLRPARAIVFGRPTLSRPVVGALLGAEDVEVIVVDPCPDWTDAARRAHLVVPAPTGQQSPDRAAPARGASPGDGSDPVRAWRAAAARASAGIGRPLWQQRAALAVWEATGAADTLVLGSSSLVRDLEQRAGPTQGRVVANRGLAGIDGTTSLAGGLALAAADPREAGGHRADDSAADDVGAGDTPAVRSAVGRIRLLVGDLTALHDLTGLIVGPEEAVPQLDIVVVDDDGGRIFSGLEHAAAPPALLRRFFTTPHGTDIAGAAAALGANSRTVSPDSLPAALAEPATGIRVIVVQEEPSRLTSSS